MNLGMFTGKEVIDSSEIASKMKEFFEASKKGEIIRVTLPKNPEDMTTEDFEKLLKESEENEEKLPTDYFKNIESVEDVSNRPLHLNLLRETREEMESVINKTVSKESKIIKDLSKIRDIDLEERKNAGITSEQPVFTVIIEDTHTNNEKVPLTLLAEHNVITRKVYFSEEIKF
jgi:hypothetical protein